MEYTVEEISPVKRKVNVTVPAEEVNAALTATAVLYKRQVDVKGFRKGKVPTDVIEAKFKKQIVGEATQDLINYQLSEIMSEMKLVPLSGLNVDSNLLEKGEDFIYSFSFEVAPAIDLPEYRGLKVQEAEAEIDDEEVEKVVNRVRDNMAEFEDVTEARLAQDGDVVTVDFAAAGQGPEFEGLRANNFDLVLGEGRALEAFEEIIKTLKKGESANKEISFPDDFINEELAGKTAEMRVHLTNLRVKKLPELDDELAKKSGFSNLDAFRGAIRASYQSSRQQLYKSQAQKKLLDSLTEGLEYELPPSLVEQNIDQLLADLEQRLDRQGKSLKSLGKSMKELRDETRPRAEEMARSQVFLLAVAAAEEMTVSPEEVNQEIARQAQSAGQDFENLRLYYEQSGLNIMLKDRMLADKAMELIYEAAEVEKVPASELEDAETPETPESGEEKSSGEAEAEAGKTEE